MPKKRMDEKSCLFPWECFHLVAIWRCHFGVTLGKERSSPAPGCYTSAGTDPLLPPLEDAMQKRGWKIQVPSARFANSIMGQPPE